MGNRIVDATLRIRTEGAEQVAQLERAIQRLSAAGSVSPGTTFGITNVQRDNRVTFAADYFKQLIAEGKSYQNALQEIARSQSGFIAYASGIARELLNELKNQTKELERQERAYRALAAAEAAAHRENDRRNAAPGQQRDRADREFRRLQAVRDAADRENKRREDAPQKLFDKEERAFRAREALRLAAYRENERFDSTKVKAQEKSDREYRQVQSAHAAALREQARRDAEEQKQLTNPIRGLLQGGGFGGSQILGLGIGAGVAFGGAKLISEIKSVISEYGDYAREIDNLAHKTGLSTQAAQEFNAVSEVTGTNIQSLVTGVRILAKGLAESTDEGKRTKAAFAELKLDPKILFGDPGEALRHIFQALKDKDFINRERIGQNLFGRSFSSFLPSIDQFENILSKVQAIGFALDKNGIEKGKEFKQQIELANQAWEQFKLSVGEKLAPVVITVIKKLEAQRDENSILTEAAQRQIYGNDPRSFGAIVDDIKHQRYVDAKQGSADFDQIKRDEAAASKRAAISEQIQAALAKGGEGVGEERVINRLINENKQKITVATDRADENSAAEIEHLQAVNDGLKQSLKYHQEIKAIRKETFALEQAAELRPFGAIGGIEAQRRDRERELNERIKENRGNPRAIAELVDQRARSNDAFREQIDFAAGQIGVQQDQHSNEIRFEGRQSAKDRGVSRAVRLAELAAGPEGPTEQAILEAEELRTKRVKERHSEEIKHANETIYSDKLLDDIGARRAAREKADAKEINELAQIKEDTEVKIAEIAKRRRDGDRELAKELRQIEVGAVRNEIVGQSKHTSRINELTFGPGREGEAIVASYRERVALAQKLYDFELKTIPADASVADQRRAQQRAFYDKEQELQEARREREIKILELQKKQVENVRNVAGGLFDALRSGPGGISKFIQGQGEGVARTVFQNAAEIAFKNFKDGNGSLSFPGTTDKDGKITGLGKLLQGTPFGPDQLKIAQKDNTEALKSLPTPIERLRASIDNLTSTITSGGIGGGHIAGAGGFANELPGLGAEDLADFETGSGHDLGLGGIAGTSPAAAGGSSSTLKGLLAGAGSVASKGLFAGLYSDDVKGTKAVGNAIASGAAVAAGASAAIAGFKQGGARGALSGTESILGVASLIPGPQQPFVVAAAAITGLVKGFLGDPKAEREKAITAELYASRAPNRDPLSFVEDSRGNQLDTDFRGRFRSLGHAPRVGLYDRVTGFDPQNPDHLTSDSQRRFLYDQSVTGAARPTSQVVIVNHNTVQVKAFDNKSVVDNWKPIGDALVKAVQSGHRITPELSKRLAPV